MKFKLRLYYRINLFICLFLLLSLYLFDHLAASTAQKYRLSGLSHIKAVKSRPLQHLSSHRNKLSHKITPRLHEKDDKVVSLQRIENEKEDKFGNKNTFQLFY